MAVERNVLNRVFVMKDEIKFILGTDSIPVLVLL